MVILGLTGSIGMGKSTAARFLCRLGVSVYEADAAVHVLLGRGGGAVGAVGAAFPGVVRGGAVDRQALGKIVFGDHEALDRLEGILHPMVRRRQHAFLRTAALHGARVVALDIPLLFESGGQRWCDATILVTAPAFIQEARVLGRPGMTRAKLAAILDRQMADRDKRRLADFVVLTGLGKGCTLRQLRRIVRVMRTRRGRQWPALRRRGYRHARSRP